MSKKGKMPLSQKFESTQIQEDLSYDPMKLSPELSRELEEQGLVGRWLNAKTLQAESNYHRSGWRVYKRPEEIRSKPRGSMDYMDGMDPEGYVRYRDLILGCKRSEDHDRHKRLIKQKTAIKSQSSRSHAAQLTQEARAKGARITITDGYEEGEGGFNKAED